MHFLLLTKAILVKIKNFCIKYWEALVALILFFGGAIFGRVYSNAKVLKKDNEIIRKNNEDNQKHTEEIIKKHINDTQDLDTKHIENLNNIDLKKDNFQKDLSNNNKKLDNVLKNKFNLKKGE